MRTDRQIPFFASPERAEAPLLPLPDHDGGNGDVNEERPMSDNLLSLRNVLLSYTVYNFELGYVQGMNDLLAPILVLMQNDADSFFCFSHFMDTRMQMNFFRDQSGMRNNLRGLGLLIRFMDPYMFSHFELTDNGEIAYELMYCLGNLFCCFRWMLVLFKREFSLDSITKLWEAIFACTFSKHFPIFIAFAILNQHRQNLIEKCTAFDETLKYVNEV